MKNDEVKKSLSEAIEVKVQHANFRRLCSGRG